MSESPHTVNHDNFFMKAHTLVVGNFIHFIESVLIEIPEVLKHACEARCSLIKVPAGDSISLRVEPAAFTLRIEISIKRKNDVSDDEVGLALIDETIAIDIITRCGAACAVMNALAMSDTPFSDVELYERFKGIRGAMKSGGTDGSESRIDVEGLQWCLVHALNIRAVNSYRLVLFGLSFRTLFSARKKHESDED